MARVLIVEDEPTDRVIVGRIVEGAGHEVYFASNGVQALNIQIGVRIDVVITDLHMPHGGGLELIDALRVLLPETVVIAVSGKGPELLAAAKRKGVLAALGKPVDPDELVEALEQATPHQARGPGEHQWVLRRPATATPIVRRWPSSRWGGTGRLHFLSVR